jgi:hypothetical protein
MKTLRRSIATLAASALAAVTSIGVAAANGPLHGQPITPTGQVTVTFLGERTADDMARDANLQSSAPTVEFNLPTMPLDQYVRAKQAMIGGAAPQGKPAVPAAASTPVISSVNFAAASECDNGVCAYPPDTEGAAGAKQIVQTTNSSVEVWKKANPPSNLLKSTADTAFFGTTDFLGDQRVLYDAEFNRFVIVADDFTIPSNAFNNVWLAVSKTANPTGSWYIYKISFSGGPFVAGNFFDFPNMGMDQDAYTFTGNIFSTTGPYVTTTVFAIAKARIYNGKGFSFPAFNTNAVGTITPSVQIENPDALDQNPIDWFAAAPNATSTSPSTIIPLYIMEFSSKNGVGTPQFFFWGNVTVPGYSLPPLAPQPSPCNVFADDLDTGDNRFSNVCRQTPITSTFPYGTLFCAHTVNLGNAGVFPAITFYQLNPNSLGAPAQTSTFFYSGSSYDFNPSIDSDSAGDAYLTWSVTNGGGSAGTNPAVVFGGRKSTDPLSTINVSSTAAATSPVCLSGNFDSSRGFQRWGDYSATSVDPASLTTATNNAWIVNETAGTLSGSSIWTSHITRLHK